MKPRPVRFGRWLLAVICAAALSGLLVGSAGASLSAAFAALEAGRLGASAVAPAVAIGALELALAIGIWLPRLDLGATATAGVDVVVRAFASGLAASPPLAAVYVAMLALAGAILAARADELKLRARSHA